MIASAWTVVMIGIWAGSLPAWLELHPGVSATPVESPGMTEVSYLFAGKPVEAAEHYKAVFAKADLPFAASADGIGVMARVAARECDLMLQFHPSGKGTTVRIYCTAKTTAAQAAQFYVPPTVGSQRVGSQRIVATPMGSESVSMSGPPYTPRNDAPALQWPGWLGLIGTNDRLRTEKTYISGMPCLRASYLVDPSQRKPIIMGYRNLMQSYGFQVERLDFSTGNTITGKVVEDFRGYVEGSQSSDGTPSGPSTILKISFSRQGSTVNTPGTITVCVCTRGGLR